MLHIRIIERLSDLEALVPAWRELLARAPAAEPVMTPLWLLTWWKVFGDTDGRTLRVLAVDDDGQLVGLVPLLWRNATHRRAIPVRRVELLATGEDEADEIASDYVGGLVAAGREDDVAQAFARALVRGELGDWDELRMTAMNGEAPLGDALVRSLAGSGVTATLSPKVDAPYIPLPKTWDEYLQALGSSRRYVVTRSLRELEKWAVASAPAAPEAKAANTPASPSKAPKKGKAEPSDPTAGGRIALVAATTAEQLAEGQRILRALHSERWSAAGRSGVFASERFARFHDEVMPRLLAGEDGATLDLVWLTVNGAPVAAAYNVVFRDKIYFYQSGRAVDVPKNVRPGIALHAFAIRRAIENGRREYDFLAGTSRYKRDLALAMRPIVELRAVAPTLRARAVEAARVWTERAIARLREARGRTPAPSEEHAPE